MSENETPVELELTKPSRLDRIKSGIAVTAFFVVPSAVLVGSVVAGYRMSSMQLETAKLNLEAARLNKQ